MSTRRRSLRGGVETVTAVDFFPNRNLVPRRILAELEQYRQKNMPEWRKKAEQQ
jgi:hypothetical protein